MKQGDTATIIGYVQHKSGKGALWPVIATPEKKPSYWLSVGPEGRYDLPVSEFDLVKRVEVEVPPEDQWEDVTHECSVGEGCSLYSNTNSLFRSMPSLTILHKDEKSRIMTDVFHPAQRENYQVRRTELVRTGKGTLSGTEKTKAFTVLRKVPKLRLAL